MKTGNGFPSPGMTGASKKFHLVACHVMWREFCHYASLSPHVFTFDFLEQGLHNTPDVLRRRLQDAIDSAPEDADAVLVGYGLCSNGTAGIRARAKPLVFMRGHDCITFLLGSKDLYRKYFDENPGTYWYSAGWIDTSPMPGPERYEELKTAYARAYGEENAAFLMESEQGWFRNYSCAAYIETGIGDETACKDYSRRCAEWLKWDFRVFRASPGLIRGFCEGRWPDDEFLIVQPGFEVAASHGEGVVKTVPPDRT